MSTVVPKGSKITIYKDNAPLFQDINMFLEEDMTLQLSSQFSPVLGDTINKLGVIAGGLSQELFNFGFSGQFKQFGYQTWDKTEPLKFNFTVGLYMEKSAETDVIDPALSLIKLPLPTDRGKTIDGVGLTPPGPTVLTALGLGGKVNVYYLEAGFLYLNPVIFKQVQPLFSRHTDDKDYPIFAVLQIQAETVFTATTNMVDTWKFTDITRKNRGQV